MAPAVVEPAPFIHRFRTARACYVWDVNTRRILRVSRVVWDVLEYCGRLDEAGLVARLSASYEPEQIREALAQIAAKREQGLLLSFRPTQVVPPSRAEVARRLASRRRQLVLNVTDACNFRCAYCVYSDAYPQFRDHGAGAMDWRVAKAAIDDFLAHSGDTEDRVVSFYGGEPLLNLKLIRRVVTAVRKRPDASNVHFSITTNGSLLTGEAAKFVADNHFMVVVSLDGPQRAHDRNRRTADGCPTWEIVCRNLREFLRRYPQYETNHLLRFSAVTTVDTDLEEAAGFWSGCDFLTDRMGIVLGVQREEGGNEASASSVLAESTEWLHRDFLEAVKTGRFAREHFQRKRWVQASLFNRDYMLLHRRGYLTPHLPERMVLHCGCIPGQRRTFVDTKGDCYACERVVPCAHQHLGNVLDGGVDESRAGELVARWHAASSGACRSCWCVSHCVAGCFAVVGEDGRITAEAKGEACARYRRYLDALLRHYASVMEENSEAFDYTASYEMQ